MAKFDEILADALASYDHLLAAGVPPGEQVEDRRGSTRAECTKCYRPDF